MTQSDQKRPQAGNPDEIDKIIYSMVPDTYGHCARQMSHNKFRRASIREQLNKAYEQATTKKNESFLSKEGV